MYLFQEDSISLLKKNILQLVKKNIFFVNCYLVTIDRLVFIFYLQRLNVDFL